MPKGYSVRLVEINRACPDEHVGVLLGRACIARDIPVTDVAEFFNVSRQTVYNWFMGKVSPNEEHTEAIRALMNNLQ